MSEEKLLQVGDVIYGTKYDTILKFTVDRVTKTLAIAKNSRFKRNIHNGTHVKYFSSTIWDTWVYRIATDELNEQYYRSRLISEVRGSDWLKLSTKALIEILGIIKSEY